MRTATTIAIGLLISVSLVHAQDPAALIDEALAAHGGEAALGQWANQHVSGSMTFNFGTGSISGTMEMYVREATMIRNEAMMEFGGSKQQFASACTGKSAWQQMGSRVYDLPPDDFVTSLRHQPNILLRAAAEGAELSYAGALELDGEPVEAIDFKEEAGTTRILLDKENGWVRALEYKAMSNQGMGQKEEVFFKTVWSDYREVGGVPFPHTTKDYRDGVERMTVNVESVVLDETPAIELFARPEAEDEAKEWSDQIAS